MKKISTTAAAWVVTSTAALAHPGEHSFAFFNTLSHLVTEPDHLAIIVVAVVGVMFARKYFRRTV